MISDNFVPLIKFLITVIYIDDNKEFIDYIEMGVDSKHGFKTFTSPSKALEFLENSRQVTDKFIKKHLSISIEDLSIDLPALNINLPLLNEIIYDDEITRFSLNIIVVSDYSMPQLDGLTLFSKLNNKFFKKIMLTGEATPEEAIEGFNAGVINGFIQKSKSSFLADLDKMTTELELKFFQEITSSMLDVLRRKKEFILEDPAFIELFNTIVNENQIVEYYLQDESGSFLMFDEAGRLTWLVVKNEEDMREALELASGDSGVPESRLNGLKNKKIFPIFQEPNDKIESARSWLYHNASCLKGRENYYYAVLNDTGYFEIDRKKYISFQDYKAKTYG